MGRNVKECKVVLYMFLKILPFFSKQKEIVLKVYYKNASLYLSSAISSLKHY